LVQESAGSGLGLVRTRRDLLSVKDVAELLGICTAVVYELVSKGELPHVRVSNMIRVGREDFDAFLKARRARGKR
jgi:excisionase family DNA binding protein